MILGLKTARNNSLCKLNLRMDGADNGTIFTDSSPSGKTVTVINALTKTATKKFGTASGYFNGSTAYLRLADNADFESFTKASFETWIYLTALPSTVGTPFKLFDKDTGASPNRQYTIQIHNSYPAANSFVLNFFDNTGGNKTYTYNGVVVVGELNTWIHFAIVLDLGSVPKLFKNGVSLTLTDSGGTNNGTLGTGNAPYLIGARIHSGTPAHFLNGYLDSAMFYKNMIKYKRSFTVPNRAA